MSWLQKLHGAGGMGVGGPADWTRFVQDTGAGPMAYQQLWKHFQGQPHAVGTLPKLPNMPKVPVPTMKAGAGQVNPQQQQQKQQQGQQPQQQQQQPIAGSQVKIDPLAFQKLWKQLRLTPEMPEAQVPQAGIPPQFRPKPRTSANSYQVGRRPRSQQHLIQDYYRWVNKLQSRGELPRGGEADWRRFMNERGWGESALGMLQSHFLGGKGITAAYSPPEYFTDYEFDHPKRKPHRSLFHRHPHEEPIGPTPSHAEPDITDMLYDELLRWRSLFAGDPRYNDYVGQIDQELNHRHDTGQYQPPVRELTKVGGPRKKPLDEDWMVKNILSHYKLLTPEETEGGRRWYRDAREWANKIAEDTNKDPNRVYATIAALSPNEEWDSNLRNAAHMLYNYDPSMGDDPKGFLPTMGENVRRAIAVHNAEKPEEMFRLFDPQNHPKINSFYKNFTGNEDAVTIDRWMTRVLLGENGNLVDQDQGAKELSGQSRYQQMANAIRKATSHINQGLSSDQQITPAQLQAMLWLRARGPAKEQKSFGPLSVPIADYLLKEPYDESKAEPTYSPPKIERELKERMNNEVGTALSQFGDVYNPGQTKKDTQNFVRSELPGRLKDIGYHPWNPEVENRRRKPVYEGAPGWHNPSRVPFDAEMLELPQSAFALAASFKRRVAARRCAPLADQFKRRTAARRQYFESARLASVFKRRVAGWEWDDHLNGYVATAANKFACDCGEEEFDTPSYHKCKCGKLWNSYVIGTGGDRKQATAEKYICREIPERPNMLVAHRKSAEWDQGAPAGWHPADGGWEHESGDARIIPAEGRQGHYQLLDRTVRGQGHWAPIKAPSINPEHLMNFADWSAGRLKRPRHHLFGAYSDSPHVLSDQEIQQWLHDKEHARHKDLEQQRYLNEHQHRRNRFAAAHPLSHPAKPACQQCWVNSSGDSNDYLERLKANHHEELVHEFHKDKYLSQQKPQGDIPGKAKGPGRYRAANRKVAEGIPSAPHSVGKGGEELFHKWMDEHANFDAWLGEHAMFHKWLDEHPQFQQWLGDLTPNSQRDPFTASRRQAAYADEHPERFPYPKMTQEDEAFAHRFDKPPVKEEVPRINPASEAYKREPNVPLKKWVRNHQHDYDWEDLYGLTMEYNEDPFPEEWDRWLRQS